MPARFLRDNAFLVAAVSLPLGVVGVFLLVTAIPKWTVPPPQYDLLLQTTEYGSTNPAISVGLLVRDEALHATVRAVKDGYAPRVRLWRFDHATLSTREIPMDFPTPPGDGDAAQPVAVEALRGRRVVTDPKAPDGYQVRTSRDGGPGVIGDIFGMRRYGQPTAIMNRGRVVSIEIPTANRYEQPAFVGWIVNGGRP
ncbi:MAG TPA: hypothetical protein VKA59_12240 [Vicinamibacterales bacterium]|nr:hypothetical protein [Vicinamibacterales bacterium]